MLARYGDTCILTRSNNRDRVVMRMTGTLTSALAEMVSQADG
jgi:hypothetical protein